MQHINLETFANGAFSAQVNRAIEEVAKNIQDPNTDASAARKVTVTIGFKPNQERNFIATAVQTKTTLAPALGAVTALGVGKDLRTGEVDCVEIGSQIPGQLSLNLEEPEAETARGYDPSTGEIFETEPKAENKVINLREAK